MIKIHFIRHGEATEGWTSQDPPLSKLGKSQAQSLINFVDSAIGKNSTNNIVKILMVLFWSIVSFLIISEGLELLHLPEILTYISASSLSFLHIYNLNYCTCDEEECCIHEKK